MIAATRDNVGVAALAAVEKFGATLAICDDTEMRIEAGIRVMQGSRVVDFIKSKIGYYSGDSCNALSSSNGGIRFLALAAALSTWDHFEAAQSTREMLKDTSRTDEILPTLGQLNTLYKALEYKITTMGFADKLMEWHILIVDGLRTSGLTTESSLFDVFGNNIAHRAQHATAYPNPETMAALVREFRNLYRLGDASKLEIRAGSSSIWIIAFVVWCTGIPPKIILKNGHVISRPNVESKIDVWAFVDDEEVEIRTTTRLDEPQTLWKGPLSGQYHHWSGMVSVEDYGQRDIQDCEWDRDLGERAFKQGIVHSTGAVMSRIFLMRGVGNTNYGNHEGVKTSGSPSQNQLQPRQSIGIRQFESRVQATISKFVGLERDKSRLRFLKEGERVQDLPMVNCYIESLKRGCPCAYCSSDPSSLDECAVDWFEYYFSTVTAKIITISVFEMTESVRLFFGGSRLPWDTPSSGRLIARVGKILFPETRFHKSLFGGELAKIYAEIKDEHWISISEIFHLGLSMIGHDVPFHRLYSSRWIASTQRGQVVYPQLFESRYLNPQNILLIGGGPGALRHNEEDYTLVMGSDMTVGRLGAPQTTLHEQPVVALMNLIQSGKLEWSVGLSQSHMYRCGRLRTDFRNRFPLPMVILHLHVGSLVSPSFSTPTQFFLMHRNAGSQGLVVMIQPPTSKPQTIMHTTLPHLAAPSQAIQIGSAL
jgi:hypothetical protein